MLFSEHEEDIDFENDPEDELDLGPGSSERFNVPKPIPSESSSRSVSSRISSIVQLFSTRNPDRQYGKKINDEKIYFSCVNI